MNRRLVDGFTAQTAAELHPDLTFEEVEAPPQETHVSRPAQHVPSSDSNDLHPDLDFDPDIAVSINKDVHRQPIPTEISERVEELDGLVSDSAPDKEMECQDNSCANELLEGNPEGEPDPLDLAISLSDVAELEENAPLDVDWFDDLVGTGAEETGRQAEALDVFDFDIFDLEAELEAELGDPETPTARDQRLDGVAADLVLGLGAFRSSERRALHRRFRAVLEEFPHHASHLALHRLLRTGASLEEIEEAAILRRLWLEQPWLWGQKRRVLGAWEVWRNPGQRLSFGWPTALRLVRAFGIVEAERSLVEDWLQTWIALQRHQASDLAEEMAFFAYSEFLRHVSRPFILAISEGVDEEPSERGGTMEVRDGHGLPIWRFERKFPQQDGVMSLETPRIRSYRKSDAAAREDDFGLGGLQSVTMVELLDAGCIRGYEFPEQACVLTVGTKIQLHTESGHGYGELAGIDVQGARVTLWVPKELKHLLAHSVAIRGSAPAQARSKVKPGKGRSTTTIEIKDKQA